MKTKYPLPHVLPIFFVLFCFGLRAQLPDGVYMNRTDHDGAGTHHELKILDDYLIHSVYAMGPAQFRKTRGGFYTVEGDSLKVRLEFNSNYEDDGETSFALPYSMDGNTLVLHSDSDLRFEPLPAMEQDLDGTWLFATRGPDKGQDRRDDSNPRKTLKWLQDGRFQWIAYNTETMKFFGTGGGSYTAQHNVYTENIEYFSRDDSRSGASLQFQYRIKNGEWHHTGKNSRGEDMYEIWWQRSDAAAAE